MSQLSWIEPGSRVFEAGVDRGVFYPPGKSGVAWDGLVSVNETGSGGSSTPLYYDGSRYLNVNPTPNFNATIEAFTYPPEFEEFNGDVELEPGLRATHQPRRTFSMCYRTLLGDDVNELGSHYKLNLVYNLMILPPATSRRTKAAQTDPSNLSWNVKATPVPAVCHKPTAHLVIDSRETYPSALKALEDVLYGTATTEPRMPTQNEVIQLMSLYGPNKTMPLELPECYAGPKIAIPPMFVGQRPIGWENWSGTSTHALPAGTQLGDILIVSVMSGTLTTFNDSRFEKIPGRDLWFGRAETLDPITITYAPTGGNNWVTGLVTSWRGAGNKRMYLDPVPLARRTTSGPSGNLPAVPEGYAGALCIFFTSDGIGGVYGDQNWGRSPGWSHVAGHNASYTEINIAYTAQSPMAEVLTPNHDSNAYWDAWIFGIPLSAG